MLPIRSGGRPSSDQKLRRCTSVPPHEARVVGGALRSCNRRPRRRSRTFYLFKPRAKAPCPLGVLFGIAGGEGGASPYRGPGGVPQNSLFPFGVSRAASHHGASAFRDRSLTVADTASNGECSGGAIQRGGVQRGRSHPLPGVWGCPPDSFSPFWGGVWRRPSDANAGRCRLRAERSRRGSQVDERPETPGNLPDGEQERSPGGKSLNIMCCFGTRNCNYNRSNTEDHPRRSDINRYRCDV
jgi:hypothetical protein